MAVRGRDGGLEGWREGDFTKCDLHAPRRAAYREGGRPRSTVSQESKITPKAHMAK